VEQNEPSFYLRDGDVLIKNDDYLLKDRRRLQESGVIFTTLVMDKNNVLYVDPIIEILGIPTKLNDVENTKKFIELSIDNAVESLPKAKKRDSDFMLGYIEKSIRNDLYPKWGKKPIIKVRLTYV